MRAARESAGIQREGESPGCPPAHHLPRGVPLGRRKHRHGSTECHHAMRAPYSPIAPDGICRILTLLRCKLRRYTEAMRFGYMKHQARRTGTTPSGEVCYIDLMRAVRISGVRKLRGLKNISWLTARQLNRLAGALTMSRVEKHGIIFDEKHSPESAYVLLSGVARITCRNRKGDRALVIMVAPGMIPGFPPPVAGISYNFRCEAVTECQIGA